MLKRTHEYLMLCRGVCGKLAQEGEDLFQGWHKINGLFFNSLKLTAEQQYQAYSTQC